MPYEKNHYFPQFCLQYWKKDGAKLYDKKTKVDRDFNPAKIFHKSKFYWFDGTDQYEKRLGKIEQYMSTLLKKIEDEEKSVNLTDFEIYFIQFYLLLQSSRQLNTTEVIKDDESGIYQSNNFLFGVRNIKDSKSMESLMIHFLETLEYMLADGKDGSKDLGLELWASSLHLNIIRIIRENNSQICVSEVSTIIENDMDGNFLYAYFPQTPKTAFLLIKTKYFFNENYIARYMKRFLSSPRESISPIISNQNICKLKCQYEKENFSEFPTGFYPVSLEDNIEIMEQKTRQLSYITFDDGVFDEWNKIIFDEGQQIIHSQDESYIKKLEEKPEPEYRHIIFWPFW